MDHRVNIILAGVGGQGLVLTTDIVCEVGFRMGYDVKSNDVVGLSQRGGKVWGSVRMGKKVHSPNIAMGHTDYLIALEPLEALRWQSYVRPGGKVFVNTNEIYPVFAIAGQSPYPHDFMERFRMDVDVVPVNAAEIAAGIGNQKAANSILLGLLAKDLPFEHEVWKEVISEKVPQKAKEINLKGFAVGYEWR